MKYHPSIELNCSSFQDSSDHQFHAVVDRYRYKKITNRKSSVTNQIQKVKVNSLLGDVDGTGNLTKPKGISSKIVIVNGDFNAKGDKTMTKNTTIKQHLDGATVYGNVVAADVIKDSFNTIEQSNANSDLKETLKLLAEAVDKMVQQIPDPKRAAEAADDMKRLAEEAVKPEPSQKWYSVSIEGLIKAADNLGEVGKRVITLSNQVLSILTGGLLKS